MNNQTALENHIKADRLANRLEGAYILFKILALYALAIYGAITLLTSLGEGVAFNVVLVLAISFVLVRILIAALRP